MKHLPIIQLLCQKAPQKPKKKPKNTSLSVSLFCRKKAIIPKKDNFKFGFHCCFSFFSFFSSLLFKSHKPVYLFFFPGGIIVLVLFCVFIMYLGKELFFVYSAANFLWGSFLYWKIVVIHWFWKSQSYYCLNITSLFSSGDLIRFISLKKISDYIKKSTIWNIFCYQRHN